MFSSKSQQHWQKGSLRIIGAISRDLNGMPPNERRLDEVDEEAHVHATHIHDICREFCSNSTVHGVRYFTEPKRHWLERVWWSIAFTCSVIACFYSIWSIWSKWSHKPVIVTFDDKTTSVGMIPFPAVTICSSQKFIKQKVNLVRFNDILTEMRQNQSAFSKFTPVEVTQLDAILQTCSIPFFFPANATVPSNPTIYETIENLTFDQNNTIPAVTWLDRRKDDAFQPLYTEEGLCFTFNTINSDELYTDEVAPEIKTVRGNPSSNYWNKEDGYPSNVVEKELYPYRAFGSGIRDSLNLYLTMVLDDSHKTCTINAPGFRISLHAPDDLPRMTNDFIHIPPEQDVYISIKPNVVTTSKNLRKYSSYDRGCYFKTERNLSFFQTYTQKRCQIECYSNYTKKECGCVQFALPREKTTRICTMTDMVCLIIGEDKFDRDFVVDDCNCMPDCTTLSYHVEISQSQSSFDDKENKSSSGDGFLALTKLFLSFKENYYISVNRSETSTMPDFISSCGGLLGLFMGISVLSVIELIYFFTLRLCCRLRRQQTLSISDDTWAKRNHFTIVTNQFERHRN